MRFIDGSVVALLQFHLLAGMTWSERTGWRSTLEVEEKFGLELLLREPM